MRKNTTVILLLLIGSFTMTSQSWKTPTIEGYGRIMDYENAEIQPDSESEYKILFNITTAVEREGVNVSLWKIARMINLLENADVPKENIHLAAVISGPATPVVLNEAAYLKKMHKLNPNLDLMQKLKDYGVVIHLCGQAAGEQNLDPQTELNPYTKLTLSALTDITHYQSQGYIVMF